MTITLNVLITLTSLGKIFSVWSEPTAGVSRIEQTVGAGLTVTDAIDDWFDNLPSYFFIDDERIKEGLDMNNSPRKILKLK